MNRNVLCSLALVTGALSGAPSFAAAEYRCANPQRQEDVRACALARQGPDQLRRFVERTAPIYHLHFYDYVTDADFERWEAERKAAEEPIARSGPAGKSGTGGLIR